MRGRSSSKLHHRRRSQAGASIVEYILLAALILLTVTVAVTVVGNLVNQKFTTVEVETRRAGGDGICTPNSPNYNPDTGLCE